LGGSFIKTDGTELADHSNTGQSNTMFLHVCPGNCTCSFPAVLCTYIFPHWLLIQHLNKLKSLQENYERISFITVVKNHIFSMIPVWSLQMFVDPCQLTVKKVH